MGWLLPSKTTSWPAACSLHFQSPLKTCHERNEVPLSMPGPSEALSSEAAFPGREGHKEEKQGLGCPPQVLLGPMAVSPWAGKRSWQQAPDLPALCLTGLHALSPLLHLMCVHTKHCQSSSNWDYIIIGIYLRHPGPGHCN